ncbi:hypothetical protein CIB84_015222 [Bambusicola thoracicus]|uniref:Uncharacterized protein n=1 Tax=Bambusicola thoracicus TaxID=9083 RepID=A0A2P4SA89_BAMTH|nr:hypothetical protein CIB84_015222 [Bambusicola thoracicus]
MQSSLGSRMSVKGMDCSSSRCCRSPLAVSLGSSSGRGGSPSRKLVISSFPVSY